MAKGIDKDAKDTIHASHLVVCQHGLHGSDADFVHFVRLLHEHLAHADVFVHSATCNAQGFFQTYDGVDTGGQRLADEILGLSKRMPNLTKFSLIGHSLGGLYSRYCLGILYARGFFQNVQPMNFVTLATPHLGIRRPQRGSFNFIYNTVAPRLFDRTGDQLSLRDTASDLTQQLSVKADQGKLSSFEPTAFTDIEGMMFVRVTKTSSVVSTDDSDDIFIDRLCELRGRKLSIFTHHSPDETLPEQKIKKLLCTLDLAYADVTLVLAADDRVTEAEPMSIASASSSLYSAVFSLSGRSDRLALTNVASGPIELRIRYAAPSEANAKTKTEDVLCEIHIPEEELRSKWKWLVALSNSVYGIKCEARSDVEPATARTKPRRTQDENASNALLSCLARGQFMQALQLFKSRSLYANIFFDFQVPYSCAAIRAFNPYRLEPSKCVMSPVYHHITLNSLWNAPLLRETLHPELKATAVKKSPMKSHSRKFSSGRSKSRSWRHAMTAAAGDDDDDEAPGSLQRHSSAVSLFADQKRSDPFIDGQQLLDRPQETFTTDPARDTLRGMLVSLQSVGWRRFDVLFENMLAHEKIIAKRASADKPLDWGLDVVHHLMDTFYI
ncbi:TPA: hypothetical protein N0F65_012481 [Lagenidium giganteum]|uniref:DUF676 domain-containing protein n=1 Tax=Lagenidium giganteum TaxID=4803 RepID=A0AAV2YQX4_9STRA|nr:TPA: hypothetical protein N0F65_012481 [Lagenidium giganteum]